MIDSASYVGQQVTDQWFLTRDGDPHARDLFDSHYSRIWRKDGRRSKLFVGPGFKRVLVVPEFVISSHDLTGPYWAMFVWRDFCSMDGQDGLNCSIFRNESPYLSSELILQAEEFALLSELIPHRFYTYVDPSKVASHNPGFCFIKAGWNRCGTTASGKLILEKHP